MTCARAVMVASLAACGGARPAPAPSPSPEPPGPGWFEPGVIDRAIVARRDALWSCYLKQHEMRPDLAGNVLVNFRVGAAGGVQSVRARGFDPYLDACLEGVVRTLDVPAPHDGPVDVTYPMRFGVP